MILKLKGANRVGNLFDRVLNGMRKVIHGVDTPLVAGILVGEVRDAVDDRIPHVDVRGCHVNLCAEHALAVRILALSHLLEEL